MSITHYGLFRPEVPNSPMIKDADFFIAQGGTRDSWGKSWKPIHDAASIGDARRKLAAKHGVPLSPIYGDEK